ncbi:MAG: DnaD domain protein [Eubacteriales bacterium]|nr:DnaD domain protein [Eubacteriales bacterium]
MEKISLKNTLQHTTTILPNEFIDNHMLRADGEYVKIYLLVLRLLNNNMPVEIEQLADTLELTQKDILRALHYWEKEGLLEFSAPSSEPDASLTITQVPEKISYNLADMEKSIKGTDLEQTLYMAETYLGRPLSSAELSSFYYISDALHFSSDLLEHLIEYCITRDKKSVRYMESVAINWYQQGIDSVKKAREASIQYTQNVFPVMKAFGISSRNPGSAELDYINRWNSFGFDTEIIVEACNRTLLATHQASFPYAHRILSDWKKSGVRSVSDIQALDKKHHATSQAAAKSAPSEPSSPRKNTTNAFHNFEQRSYDYDDLESRLLEKNRR